MFRISKLIFVSKNGQEDGYEFDYGMNYFQGTNNTGKTEFYKLIDFVLGDSENIFLSEWYDDVDQIRMVVEKDGVSLVLVRTRDLSKNYVFRLEDFDDSHEVFPLARYKEKLNDFFSPDEQKLKRLRSFAEETFTYRTFTMFNFLNESTQGQIQDFLSKCNSIEYSLKLDDVLNYLFNEKHNEIEQEEKRLKDLQKNLNEKELSKINVEHIITMVNRQLLILNSSLVFTGTNKKDVLEFIESLKSMELKKDLISGETVAQTEFAYNSLQEQVKVYKKTNADASLMRVYNEHRLTMLQNLRGILKDNPQLNYLTSPLETMIEDVKIDLSFSDYLLKDNTQKILEKKVRELKDKLLKNDAMFRMYSLSDKEKAISVIEECFKESLNIVAEEEITRLKKEIADAKNKIKRLKKDDDEKMLKVFSDYITKLYLESEGESEFVKKDMEKQGFYLKYLKKGNSIQPVISVTENDETREEFYYTGSMARHTLMQICGYAAFLKKMVAMKGIPLVPMLVIDHVSKAFDKVNKKSIGTVVLNFLADVKPENVQVFMFDTEPSDNLGIDEKYSKNLVTEKKTGLVPFYKVAK